MSDQLMVGLCTLGGVVLTVVFGFFTTLLQLSAKKQVRGVTDAVVNGTDRTLIELVKENTQLTRELRSWHDDQQAFVKEVRSRLSHIESRLPDK